MLLPEHGFKVSQPTSVGVVLRTPIGGPRTCCLPSMARSCFKGGFVHSIKRIEVAFRRSCAWYSLKKTTMCCLPSMARSYFKGDFVHSIKRIEVVFRRSYAWYSLKKTIMCCLPSMARSYFKGDLVHSIKRIEVAFRRSCAWYSLKKTIRYKARYRLRRQWNALEINILYDRVTPCPRRPQYVRGISI